VVGEGIDRDDLDRVVAQRLADGRGGSGGAVEDPVGDPRRTVGQRGDEVRLQRGAWIEAFVKAGRVVEPFVGEVGAPPGQLFVDSG
jgi:hypothetical protein